METPKSTSGQSAASQARLTDSLRHRNPSGAISLLLVIAGVRKVTTAHRPWKATLAMAVAVGLLFIPIRGGFTVSTMNVSRAYFSHDRFLNHAAVNPSFSLLYSATHSNGYASQYRKLPSGGTGKGSGRRRGKIEQRRCVEFEIPITVERCIKNEYGG